MANVEITRAMIETAYTTANDAKEMTQAKALAWLLENTPQVPAEVRESAERLLVSKTKKYERKTTGINKTRMENERLVPAVVDLIAKYPNDLVNASFIAQHFDGVAIQHPQKANVICRIGMEQGLIERYEYKGRPYYAIPGHIPACVTDSE